MYIHSRSLLLCEILHHRRAALEVQRDLPCGITLILASPSHEYSFLAPLPVLQDLVNGEVSVLLLLHVRQGNVLALDPLSLAVTIAPLGALRLFAEGQLRCEGACLFFILINKGAWCWKMRMKAASLQRLPACASRPAFPRYAHTGRPGGDPLCLVMR